MIGREGRGERGEEESHHPIIQGYNL